MNGFELDMRERSLDEDGVFTGSSWRNFSSWPIKSPRRSCGGGTNLAFPGREPPIQFCERLKFPGALCLPRPPERRMPCVSRISRRESGNPPRRRFSA
jgi:hypothetical protein